MEKQIKIPVYDCCSIFSEKRIKRGYEVTELNTCMVSSKIPMIIALL